MIKPALWSFVLPALLSAQLPSGAELLDSARGRLAQLDGTITVPGLDSVVEVRRDRWGVPHVYAKTQQDLFFAQGFVAAQDRLWQMEMWRRIGEGRLAEVVGPVAVERDRIARLLAYRGDMTSEWASYAPDAREIVRAFGEGVNAWISHMRTHPPIEFTLLGSAPAPWRYEVPLQRMAALAMTGNALDALERARLVHLVGVERTEALWPPDPARPLDPAPGLDLAGIDLGALGQAYGDVSYRRLEGSNNWVVNAARTATGKPLLANDPHRAIGVPSLRYVMHLVGPGWNVIGAGEPALPGIAAGHNERVGFGFTIVGMNQQDVYVEEVGPCGVDGQRCYRTRGVWIPMRVVVDTIRVRGERPASFDSNTPSTDRSSRKTAPGGVHSSCDSWAANREPPGISPSCRSTERGIGRASWRQPRGGSSQPRISSTSTWTGTSGGSRRGSCRCGAGRASYPCRATAATSGKRCCRRASCRRPTTRPAG